MEKVPGMISMLAGKPNPSLFPITSIAITVRSPVDGGMSEKVLEIKGLELDEALQYGPTSGLPRVKQWLKGLQVAAHNRKEGPDWDLAIGSGSQDLLYKVCDCPYSQPSPTSQSISGIPCIAQPGRIGHGGGTSICVSFLHSCLPRAATHMSSLVEQSLFYSDKGSIVLVSFRL